MINESRVASVIKKRFSSLKSDQQDVFDKVERYKAMYHCAMTPDESYAWEYQLTDPQIFPTVRAHLARMNPAEARIKLVGNSPNREVNQKIVNWELNEILITQLLYKVMYSGFMAGRGYAKSGWFYKPALKIKSDRGDVLMRSKQNRADLAYVRFNDLFPGNRNIPELDAQPYIVERIAMRFGELLDDQEQTKRWKPEIIQYIKDKKHFVNQFDYGVDIPKDDDQDEDAIMRSQYVSFLCMYTADAEEFWVLENGEDKICNVDTDNRYWHGHYPYLDFAPFPEDDEFFSLGIPDVIGDLEIALSSTLNQLLTNGRKAGNSMWLVGDSGKQVPDWMFTDRPNGVVRVKGLLSDYQRLDFNTRASDELLKLRSGLQTSAERSGGISSLYASGVSSSPQVNKTATGARVIDNNIDVMLQLLISLFGAQVLKKSGEHFLELNQQYITEEQTFDITGKNGKYEYVTAKPEEISANFRVQASPERLLKSSPAVKLASLQNTISTVENQKSFKADTKPLYEQLISETPGLEDIDPEAIILDPEKKVGEVIKAINENYDPPASTWDDDHKALLTIIQKHLIDTQYPDEIVKKFSIYIEELKRWIQAKNPNLVVQPPAPPQLMPTDPDALAQSMGGNMEMPEVNPTTNLPAGLTQDQLGM